eukprot:SAG31_NODE_1386_length_8574_cov_2.055037_2_plen_74_part_00
MSALYSEDTSEAHSLSNDGHDRLVLDQSRVSSSLQHCGEQPDDINQRSREEFHKQVLLFGRLAALWVSEAPPL